MPTLFSHSHFRATQARLHANANKKVCLLNCTTDRQLDDIKEQQGHNSTYPKGMFSFSKDRLMVNQIFVFQIKFVAEGQLFGQLQKEV